MGVVWRGRDVLLDRAVAVKEIVQPANDETYQRVLREGRAAARVKHPGVAAVYDVVSEDARWYIVMELVEGQPLSQVIDTEGPLPPAVVADIGRQILAALEAGHSAGVLHRDLKPSNVLITPAGRAVLTDFGIASVAGDPSITRTGIVLGTPGYLAPERASGEVATVAADLWSLGATLFAAAEGHGPFDSYAEVMAMMVAVISSDPPSPTVAEPLAGIIRALLSRDPRRRPSTESTARALAAVAAAPAPPVTEVARFDPVTDDFDTPGYQPPPASRTRRLHPPTAAASSLLQPGPGVASRRQVRSGNRRPWLAVTGVALAAAVAVTAVVLTRPSGQHAQLAAAQPLAPVAEQFRVTPVVAGDGNPSVFARDKSGHLVTSHFANGIWSGWTTVPGSPVITGVPGASSADGRIAVLARRADTGYLEYLEQSGSGTWSAPMKIGTQQVTSSAAVLRVGGLLEAYARLADGELGVATLTSGTWSDWKGLGGKLSSAPAASLDSHGNPYVFATAPFNKLVHAIYVGGHWSAVTDLPGENFDGVPAVGANPDGRLELFIHTTGGIVMNVWQIPGTVDQWGGPQTRIASVVSEAAVTNESQNRLEVFALSDAGTVLYSLQDTPKAGTSWSQPVPIGAQLTNAPAVLHLGGGGNEELFSRTQAGTIAVSVRDAGQGDWSTPTPIGGDF